MVGRIYHVGLTVSDLDKSIAFYRDILGLKYQGEIMMVGEETDKMFQKKNCYNLRSSPPEPGGCFTVKKHGLF